MSLAYILSAASIRTSRHWKCLEAGASEADNLRIRSSKALRLWRHAAIALRCLHMCSLPSAAHPAHPAATRSAHSCPQYPNGQFELYNLDEDPHEVGVAGMCVWAAAVCMCVHIGLMRLSGRKHGAAFWCMATSVQMAALLPTIPFLLAPRADQQHFLRGQPRPDCHPGPHPQPAQDVPRRHLHRQELQRGCVAVRGHAARSAGWLRGLVGCGSSWRQEPQRWHAAAAAQPCWWRCAVHPWQPRAVPSSGVAAVAC